LGILPEFIAKNFGIFLSQQLHFTTSFIGVPLFFGHFNHFIIQIKGCDYKIFAQAFLYFRIAPNAVFHFAVSGKIIA
jgi:hypothetical protein